MSAVVRAKRAGFRVRDSGTGFQLWNNGDYWGTFDSEASAWHEAAVLLAESSSQFNGLLCLGSSEAV